MINRNKTMKTAIKIFRIISFILCVILCFCGIHAKDVISLIVGVWGITISKLNTIQDKL